MGIFYTYIYIQYIYISLYSVAMQEGLPTGCGLDVYRTDPALQDNVFDWVRWRWRQFLPAAKLPGLDSQHPDSPGQGSLPSYHLLEHKRRYSRRWYLQPVFKSLQFSFPCFSRFQRCTHQFWSVFLWCSLTAFLSTARECRMHVANLYLRCCWPWPRKDLCCGVS